MTNYIKNLIEERPATDSYKYMLLDRMILSISVDTFITRISIPKLQHPEIYNISVV